MLAPQLNGPLLKADGLTKTFIPRAGSLHRGGPVHALNGVGFHVDAAETLGLVGESGCGKTTLARVILRLVEPTAGSIQFDGQDVLALDNRALRRFRGQVQMIFQDPQASLDPRMRVGLQIDEALLIHTSLDHADRRKRVRELLGHVGLKADAADRVPHEFSGGQRQRIVIARALATEPSLLIADEPVSALDLSVRGQILNLLKDLQERFGLACLLISHDLGVVREMSDRVAVMYLGHVVETATSNSLFASPLHPYTGALLASIPSISPGGGPEPPVLGGEPPGAADMPAGCPFHPRCPDVMDRCRDETPTLTREGDDHFVACFLYGRRP